MAPTVLERICRRADGWLARAAGSTSGVIGDWAQIQRRSVQLDQKQWEKWSSRVNCESCRAGPAVFTTGGLGM
jgi:hypothetical protein